MIDTRNVIDYYKGWENEFIVDHLDTSRLPMSVVTENVSGDFHKANILRTAEGFNLKEFWIVGSKKWDRRAAVGAHHRMPVRYSASLADMVFSLDAEPYIVTLDNVPGAVSLYDYEWKPNTMMIVGEEQRGVSNDAIDIANDVVYIPMRGAVRSFSVSTAAGIAMSSYVQQMIK